MIFESPSSGYGEFPIKGQLFTSTCDLITLNWRLYQGRHGTSSPPCAHILNVYASDIGPCHLISHFAHPNTAIRGVGGIGMPNMGQYIFFWSYLYFLHSAFLLFIFCSYTVLVPLWYCDTYVRSSWSFFVWEILMFDLSSLDQWSVLSDRLASLKICYAQNAEASITCFNILEFFCFVLQIIKVYEKAVHFNGKQISLPFTKTGKFSINPMGCTSVRTFHLLILLFNVIIYY